MKLVWLKSKKVKRVPVVLWLPNNFIIKNNLMPNDVLDIYIAETNELIIKKRGGK